MSRQARHLVRHDERRDGRDGRDARRAGFTLVELMVSVVVMAIVLSNLLISFSHQHTSSLSHERSIEIQQEARVINEVMLADIRTAGFMVPDFAAIASIDGGTGVSDILCVSDSTIINDTVLPTATSKFTGATIMAAMSSGDSTVTVDTATMDIDADGDDDFTVGGGLLIGTGTKGHCAVISGISGGEITFAPATPSGFTAAADDVVVPAIVYQISGGTMMRNSTVLSTAIEDLQVQFGVDVNADGTVVDADGEFPINNLTGQFFDRIRNVQVMLTARDPRVTEGFAGQFTQIANRVAGAADNFKRRRTLGDTALRNIQ